MNFEQKIQKFIEEFGFYIFLFFSSLILLIFKSFYPDQVASENFYARVLIMEQIIQEKLRALSQGKISEFEGISLYLLSFIFFLIMLSSLFLFINQICIKVKGKPLVESSNFSPYPLWSLKDFFMILIWILFWAQVLSISSKFLKFLIEDSSEQKYMLSLLFGSLLFDLVILGLLTFWLKKHCRQGFQALGIYKSKILIDFREAVFYYLSFLPVLLFLIYISGIFLQKYQRGITYQPIFYFLLFEKNPLILTLTILFIILFGPLVEEVFFRGLFYSSLKKSIGVFQAMLISSLLFSLLHMNWIGFLPILSLALLFVYLYEKTGSLLIPIFIHMLHNGFLVLLIFLLRAFLRI